MSEKDQQGTKIQLEAEFISGYKSQVKEAVRLVLSDTLPDRPLDALFFHGRAHYDDDDTLFDLATSLYLQGRVRNIIINGSDGQKYGMIEKYHAWAGRAEWSRRLDKRGVDIMEVVWFTEPTFNTKQDGDEFLEVSRQKEWKTAATFAWPHQILRAFLGQIRTIRDRNYPMRVYCVYPEHTDWGKKVYGSQADEFKFRREHIRDELTRIPVYQKKGDLASFEELINYLKWRDGSLDQRELNFSNRVLIDSDFRLNLDLIQEEIDGLASSDIVQP